MPFLLIMLFHMNFCVAVLAMAPSALGFQVPRADPFKTARSYSIEVESSFEERLRSIALKPVEPPKSPVGAPKHVRTVDSVLEYKKEVIDEQEQIVVVRFYAPWCRACKSVERFYWAMVKHTPNVKYVEVPVSKNTAKLIEGLDIPTLPYAHIYDPSLGLVEELKMSKPHFKNFAAILDSYMRDECAVDYDEYGRCKAPYDRVS